MGQEAIKTTEELRTGLSAVLTAVEGGKRTFVVTRSGKPIARIVPIEEGVEQPKPKRRAAR